MNDLEYQRMYQAEDRHWWYVTLHDLILRHVAKESRHGRLAILDAGCGTGRLCHLLAGYGDVNGCDISDNALALCRQRGVTGVWRADLNSADLGDNRYDVITAIDVLYHRWIADDSAVVASFYRALKPGGLLILNLVAFEFLRSSHDVAVHTRKRYRRPETVAMIGESGLQVETAAYRLGLLFFPILCYRLLKRMSATKADPGVVASDTFMPQRWLNRLLLRLVVMENPLVAKGFGPFGTSLFITARKVGGEPDAAGEKA